MQIPGSWRYLNSFIYLATFKIYSLLCAPRQRFLRSLKEIVFVVFEMKSHYMDKVCWSCLLGARLPLLSVLLLIFVRCITHHCCCKRVPAAPRASACAKVSCVSNLLVSLLLINSSRLAQVFSSFVFAVSLLFISTATGKGVRFRTKFSTHAFGNHFWPKRSRNLKACLQPLTSWLSETNR